MSETLKKDSIDIDYSNYRSIEPTAWMVANARTFTDIPYSKDIFDQLKSDVHDKVELIKDLQSPELLAQFEARYKLINKLLKVSDIKQVLEIASGLSPRGLELSKDPSITYAELDLPQMMEEKIRIVEVIKEKYKLGTLPNLALESGNALHKKDIMHAVLKNFANEQNIAVINEGFMRYLNMSEKTQLATNVHDVLMQYGGIWITSDTLSLEDLNPEKHKQNEKIKAITDKDTEHNFFDSNEAAEEFFRSHGFEIEIHHYDEVEAELSGHERLGLSLEEAMQTYATRRIFMMRLNR